MPGELALDSAESVGAGADQISLRVFQIVLVQLQLRFGQVNLLLQTILAFGLRAGKISFVSGRCGPGQLLPLLARGWLARRALWFRESAALDARWPRAFGS